MVTIALEGALSELKNQKMGVRATGVIFNAHSYFIKWLHKAGQGEGLTDMPKDGWGNEEHQ